MFKHVSVMQKEVIEILDINPNGMYIDCTFGQGGHSLAILEKNAFLCCIDKDISTKKYYDLFKESFKNKSLYINDSFSNLKKIACDNFNNLKINGILFDLGFSSNQLEENEGFSYQKNTFLDMRYNKNNNLTASEWINNISLNEMSEVFFKYSNEKFSNLIAKNICQIRKNKKIETTFQLAEIIKNTVNNINYQSSLSRIFQAIRIVINNELQEIEQGLSQAIELLDVLGILIVITFHSVEDLIVKNFFKPYSNFLIFPTKEECKINPRATCAKLRWMVKS